MWLILTATSLAWSLWPCLPCYFFCVCWTWIFKWIYLTKDHLQCCFERLWQPRSMGNSDAFSLGGLIQWRLVVYPFIPWFTRFYTSQLVSRISDPSAVFVKWFSWTSFQNHGWKTLTRSQKRLANPILGLILPTCLFLLNEYRAVGWCHSLPPIAIAVEYFCAHYNDRFSCFIMKVGARVVQCFFLLISSVWYSIFVRYSWWAKWCTKIVDF